MGTIYFVHHARTIDNIERRASGHCQHHLSDEGIEEANDIAKENHERFARVDHIFSSDLNRARETAEIIAEVVNYSRDVITDSRLRAVNYGDLEHEHRDEIDKVKVNYIDKKFPGNGGESYEDRVKLMKAFVDELKANYPDQTLIVVGHPATYYALKQLLSGIPLEQSVKPSGTKDRKAVHEFSY